MNTFLKDHNSVLVAMNRITVYFYQYLSWKNIIMFSHKPLFHRTKESNGFKCASFPNISSHTGTWLKVCYIGI